MRMSRCEIQNITSLKISYFLLFCAYGSMMPYMALYLRQIGLNAGHVGAIAGVRPLVQFISCPFWAVIADRYNLRRTILNISIVSWLLFTVVLFIPKPTVTHCPENLMYNLSAVHHLESPMFQSNQSLKSPVSLDSIGDRKTIIPKIKTFLVNFPEFSHISERHMPHGNPGLAVFLNDTHYQLIDASTVYVRQKDRLNLTVKKQYSTEVENMQKNHGIFSRTYSENEASFQAGGPFVMLSQRLKSYFLQGNPHQHSGKFEKVIEKRKLGKQQQNIGKNVLSKDNSPNPAEPAILETKRGKRAKRSTAMGLVDEERCMPAVFYDKKEVQAVFTILFMLTAIGEFFEAPTVTFLDTAVLESLGEGESGNYGRIRLYGSLGFGVSSFLVGIILDYTQHPLCGRQVTNFLVILYFFVAWMTPSIIFTLMAVRFPNPKNKEMPTGSDDGSKKELEKQIPHTSDETGLFATLAVFKDKQYALYLITALYLGFSHGCIMNFINWYMEDLGATRLMMGLATILRDVAVVFGFYVSPDIMSRYSESTIVMITFVIYVCSFFCYSLIDNAWLAIPVESVQGIAYALMWSSCITYLGGAVNTKNLASMQGIIQGVYWGLGTGLGAIIGGYSIHQFGSKESFKLGGYLTLVVGMIYAFFNYFLFQIRSFRFVSENEMGQKQSPSIR